ncbi:hypothetical protein F0919_14645 [Taibaiella lutea]|uniref:NodB homology domain-containing protein n=1 Tax=Taibaiella lutea TaxID=2608001 RepID=A0A5M6CFE2_9BACT|nr:hypothetical protein [Taibaiella lutea]KAA5533767.1 hypothetical protein F0919_14645 [Taibaiella lutea]
MKNDFTLQGYETLLKQALDSGYQFCSFENIYQENLDKICYLRHDIDADVTAAFKLAEIENSLGVRATYFFMLRSPVYNLFSRFNQKLVERIIKLDHHIALHFDENFACERPEPLQNQIERELDILNSNFGINTNIVSFHQPSERILQNKIQLKNIIHTYDKPLFKDIHYVSDSNKNWRNDHPFDTFKEQTVDKIQLLIHPMWWVFEKNYNTRTVWKKTLINNFNLMQNQILETEGAFGGAVEIKLKDK